MHSALTLQTLSTRLKFRHLVLLDALGRSHNMHVAAQQMNLTQPAATKILHDIEDIFGFPVFERLPRNMRPTDLGEFVIRFARETLRSTEKFAEELEHMKRGGYGTLLVGATYGIAFLTCVSVMKIKERHPLLSVRVLERTSELLLDALKEKTVDVVIGRFRPEFQHYGFDFRGLAATEMCLVVSPAHPLLTKPDLSFAALLDWPWILHPRGTSARKLFEQTLADQGLRAPTNVVETTSIFATLQLLHGSEMIAILPISAANNYIHRGMVAQLPLHFERYVEDYGIITRKDEELTSATNEFIEIAIDIAHQHHLQGRPSGTPAPTPLFDTSERV